MPERGEGPEPEGHGGQLRRVVALHGRRGPGARCSNRRSEPITCHLPRSRRGARSPSGCDRCRGGRSPTAPISRTPASQLAVGQPAVPMAGVDHDRVDARHGFDGGVEPAQVDRRAEGPARGVEEADRPETVRSRHERGKDRLGDVGRGTSPGARTGRARRGAAHTGQTGPRGRSRPAGHGSGRLARAASNGAARWVRPPGSVMRSGRVCRVDPDEDREPAARPAEGGDGSGDARRPATRRRRSRPR